MRTTLGTTIIIMLGLGTSACGESYGNTELRLLVNFAAKETCSCVFVMRQSDAACLEYSRQFIPVGNVDIRHGQRRVDATQGGTWAGTARFVDDRLGCVLEPSGGP